MATGRPSNFHTTRWSLIAALPGGSGKADGAAEALQHLCDAYWRPLYTFARYSGYSADDAQDITQAFLTSILERKGLGGADPARGRFRSYLLGAMKHFMANERERKNAKKRGGGHRFVRGDLTELESRIGVFEQPQTPDAAERAFDRNWAHETTASALRELEAEWVARGKADQFSVLRSALSSELADRSGVASRLGITENALGVAVHRLRQRYAALVRDAVAQTVADEADIEDELRYLIEVLREN